MTALRALLRVELRELRRNAARSWLVILLVLVPVAAMVGGSGLLLTARPTTEERRAAVLGTADLRVELRDARSANELERELPGDALVCVITSTGGNTGSGTSMAVVELDTRRGELAQGLLELVDGRMPREDELALSPAASRALGATLGDHLELDGERSRVVGVVRSPEELASEFVVRECPAGRFPRSALVSYAEPELLAARLRTLGLGVVMRDELGAPDPFETLVVFVAGGFALFECALVIAAAFAVGLRRRQRELGLLAACGAVRSSLRVGLALSALAFAMVGSGLGVVVGVGAAFALHPFQDTWNGRANGALEFESGHVIGAVLLALVTAVIAASVPAIGATRLPIRVALAGRRPVTEGSRAWLVLGGALIVLGLAAMALGVRLGGPTSALAVLAGSIAVVLGFGAASPALLGGLARLARPLPLAPRLALRDTSRFRARNGPVVTAILAATAVGVMLSVLASAVNSRAGAGESADLFLAVAVAACLLTSLVIVFVATTLSAVESAQDARTLQLLGADPKLIRLHAAMRASALAAIGALLAVPAGLLPGRGLLALAEVELEFALPWPTLTAVVLGLPLLAFVGAWLVPRAVLGALPRS